MKQRPTGRTSSSEKIIRDIKRNTRKQTSAEEKIRIVLDGVRGEASIAELWVTFKCKTWVSFRCNSTNPLKNESRNATIN